jgi:hypothetical protein
VNDLPLLVVNRTEIEKIRLFFLYVSEEEKAAHHPRVVGVLFRPSFVFAKDGLSRLFFLHARHVDRNVDGAADSDGTKKCGDC